LNCENQIWYHRIASIENEIIHVFVGFPRQKCQWKVSKTHLEILYHWGMDQSHNIQYCTLKALDLTVIAKLPIKREVESNRREGKKPVLRRRRRRMKITICSFSLPLLVQITIAILLLIPVRASSSTAKRKTSITTNRQERLRRALLAPTPDDDNVLYTKDSYMPPI